MVYNFAIHAPEWFFGIDGLFEGIEFVIALLLALYAYRAYLLNHDETFRYFSLAFFSITLGEAARAITDVLIHIRLNQVELNIATLPKLTDVPNFFIGGYLLHIVLITLGLLVLTLITMRVEKRSTYALTVFLVLPLIFLSTSAYLAFHYVGVFLSGVIAIYSAVRWYRQRTGTTFFVAAGYGLLALAYGQFLLDAFLHYFYVSAHITQVGAYIALLIAFLLVLRK